ncbi:PREDICTED: biogenesis of lysosome-related organelles complex 1 subunit 1-like [Prunus mume]|uniref:Biogenesis of lysosome-related organelles complex 1 subunit 1 n=1 Tax=Prunus mume TaxID=102107 RepID=A0ABM0PWL9_PRUMU|nr:PREDICTED: biogenesis of lysosome-related organelles complex 1 subunit 1-like [Prunus mume]
MAMMVVVVMAMTVVVKVVNVVVQMVELDVEVEVVTFLKMNAEKAKKDEIKKAERAAELMVDAVNGSIQESLVNEKLSEYEIRALTATITRFTKQTDQWLSVTHSMNSAIKEIRDFENWMKIMEFDCKSITAAIHNIHQA